MEYAELGSTGQLVSRLGFGGCPLGGYGWGPIDRGELRRAIGYAVQHGVTFFDTSDIYGLGESEIILGTELKRVRDVVIATKFGVRRNEAGSYYDNSPAWIERALHASLKRLQRETIDLLQLHYWDGVTPLVDILETVDRLRNQGKLRWFGLTNTDPSAHLNGRFPDWMVSFSYECSLLNRAHRMKIETLRQRKLTFLSWGSLAQGALTGKYGPDHVFDLRDRRSREVYSAFHQKGIPHRETMLAAMREIQREAIPYRTLTQIAIRWLLDRYPDAVALVGIKRESQIADVLGACDWSLSKDAFDRLDGLSLAEEIG